MATGCKENQCGDFAADWREISWTDYNTIDEVFDYFYCHPETAKMHIGDTFSFSGYILPESKDPNIEFDFDSVKNLHDERGYVEFCLGADYTKMMYEQRIMFLYVYATDTNLLSSLEDYYYGKLLYMKVEFVSRETFDGDQCCCPLVLNALEFETKEEEEGR